MLEFGHGCQHIFVQVWLAFPVQRRPAGPRNRKLSCWDTGDLRGILEWVVCSSGSRRTAAAMIEALFYDVVRFLTKNSPEKFHCCGAADGRPAIDEPPGGFTPWSS